MKIITLVTLRPWIAIALCLSIILYPLIRSTTAASANSAADVKTESQLRAEASRYDGAIRAISEIGTMKLDTGGDLARAVTILDREAPNLKLHFSKYVALALSDSTFSAAVKRKLSNRATAETVLKQMSTDRKIVLTLDGAASVKSRIERSAASDAAVLRRAGERLQDAAERIKKAGPGSTAPRLGAARGFQSLRANFVETEQPSLTPAAMMPVLVDPLTVFAVVYVALVVIAVVIYGAAIVKNVSTEEGRDAIADCQDSADVDFTNCRAAANNLPSGFPTFQREVARASCYGPWPIAQAEMPDPPIGG